MRDNTNGTNTTYWVLQDHLGSTTVNVDENTGLVEGEWWYYPYGSKRYNDGALHTTYRYTGQRRGEDDLYWYRSRPFALV